MDEEEFEHNFEPSFDDVKDLARAIRLGDRDEAESILDRMVGADDVLREAVSQGRYSTATRKAA